MNFPLLIRLQYQHRSLDFTILKLAEARIRQRPNTGKWSIFENLAHLARYQEVFLSRVQEILTTDSPVFGRYVADEDPAFDSWTEKGLDEVMASFRTQRLAINQLLDSLSEQQLNRTGQHPVFGLLTVEGWIEFFLLHEAHHFFTIFKLAGD